MICFFIGKKEKSTRDLTQLFTEFVIPIVGRYSGGNFKKTPELRTILVVGQDHPIPASKDSRRPLKSGKKNKIEPHE